MLSIRALLALTAIILPVIAHKTHTKIVTSIDGAKIYAEAIGDEKQPQVLLVHGLGLSGAVFDGLFADERLTSTAYLVRYDTRGHGRSAKPETIAGHASSLYAADYAAVAKAFGLINPLFVGWSLGGVVASDILEHIVPNPLSGIVYMDSFPSTASGGQLTTPFFKSLNPGLISADDVALSKKSEVTFVEGLFAQPQTVPFPVLSSWIGMTAFQTPNQTIFTLTRPQDPTALIASGHAGLPVLFLQGTDDKTLVGEKTLELLQTMFVDITVNWIEHGSHAAFYDNQTEVVTSLLAFLSRVNVSTHAF